MYKKLDSDPEEFKRELEGYRRGLAKDNSGDEPGTRNAIIRAFDLALHRDLGADYEAIEFKKLRLEKIIEERRITKAAFSKFINLYIILTISIYIV